MGVSKNTGTPKSSILIGVFHHKPSILGYPYFGNTHIFCLQVWPKSCEAVNIPARCDAQTTTGRSFRKLQDFLVLPLLDKTALNMQTSMWKLPPNMLYFQIQYNRSVTFHCLRHLILSGKHSLTQCVFCLIFEENPTWAELGMNHAIINIREL